MKPRWCGPRPGFSAPTRVVTQSKSTPMGGGGGAPPQQPPPQAPASSAFPASPPWRLGFVLDKKMRQVQDGGLRKTKETKKNTR